MPLPNARKIHGVEIDSTEHWNVAEEVLADVEKVKTVVNRIDMLLCQSVIAVSNGDQRGAILRIDQAQEGVALLKEIWGVRR